MGAPIATTTERQLAAPRIVVIDDQPASGRVPRLLASQPGVRVVGRAHDARAGVQLVRDLTPHVVVLDLRSAVRAMPDLCRVLRRASPATRVLVHGTVRDAEILRTCLRWGAGGVVFDDGQHLVPALRAVLAGQLWVEPRLGLVPRPAPAVPEERPIERLSPREHDVLSGFALGQSTREVAAGLKLTENTVRGYTKSLLAKLRARNRIQALATARRLQLLP